MQTSGIQSRPLSPELQEIFGASYPHEPSIAAHADRMKIDKAITAFSKLF
ncbi:hypothetical protein [Sphingobacterium sp.]